MKSHTKSMGGAPVDRVVVCPGAKNHIRIWFLADSEVKFLNERGRFEWYGSDYGVGTYIDVKDIISGNHKEVYVLCLDGERGVLKTGDITFVR